MGTGHAGFLRCLFSIKRKYYIYDLVNKLNSYINKCGLCLKLRNPKKNKVNVPTYGILVEMPHPDFIRTVRSDAL